MVRIVAQDEFIHPLYCSDEFLGLVQPLRILGHVGTIAFPSHPAVGGSDMERPKSIANFQKVEWGSRISGGYQIKAVVLEFDTPEAERDETAHSIAIGFNRWKERFADHTDVVTRQSLSGGIHTHPDHHTARFLYRIEDQDRFEWCERGRPPAVTVIVPNKKYAMTLDQFRTVSTMCSDQKDVSLAYKMQVLAYRALSERDCRKAVVETATAAELCLTECIQRTFDATGVGYGAALFEKFQTLGSKLRLASLVGLNLPLNYQNVLVELRNRVVHEGKMVTVKEAWDAIASVDQLLSSLQPEITV
jgi:hypothetical protein